ncbi:uncharacterized protein METZ01_LOCUS43183, partial [marine metagenome]
MDDIQCLLIGGSLFSKYIGELVEFVYSKVHLICQYLVLDQVSFCCKSFTTLASNTVEMTNASATATNIALYPRFSDRLLSSSIPIPANLAAADP